MKWKNLIDTFNNLVFVTSRGKWIVVTGTKFAVLGFSRKLAELGITLIQVPGTNEYVFSRVLVGMLSSDIDKFFNQ